MNDLELVVFALRTLAANHKDTADATKIPNAFMALAAEIEHLALKGGPGKEITMTRSYSQKVFDNENKHIIAISIEDKDNGTLITMSDNTDVIEIPMTLMTVYALSEALDDYLAQHQRNNPGN